VLARQAIQRVNDLFTWERVAAGMATLYEQVLVSRKLACADEATRLDVVDQRFDGVIIALRESKRRLRSSLLDAADAITATFARDRTVFCAGNGGSAAEAQHLAAEFVGRFRVEGRPGLAAVALGTDVASLTAWSNDYRYEDALARQLEALGRPGDLLVGLSTSGNSVNLCAAFETARARGLRTLALLGRDGGGLKALADLAVVVPSTDTQHIQEVHTVLVHVLAELVESRLVDTGWFHQSTVPEPAGRRLPADWRSVAEERPLLATGGVGRRRADSRAAAGGAR